MSETNLGTSRGIFDEFIQFMAVQRIVNNESSASFISIFQLKINMAH